MALADMVIKIQIRDMKFLKYLYFKYYSFQVWIGNKGIAKYSAMLMIVFVFMLYLFGLFFIISTFFSNISSIFENQLLYFSMGILILAIPSFYFLLIYKDKYNKILKDSSLKVRNNLIVILFTLIAFLLPVLAMCLMMLQNQGQL